MAGLPGREVIMDTSAKTTLRLWALIVLALWLGACSTASDLASKVGIDLAIAAPSPTSTTTPTATSTITPVPTPAGTPTLLAPILCPGQGAGYPYYNAPLEVDVAARTIREGGEVASELIVAHNEWMAAYNATVAPHATATMEALAPLQTATAVAAAQATATVVAAMTAAAEGVFCAGLHESETRLTSPVADYVEVAVVDPCYPLGFIRRDYSPRQATAFELMPETEIVAPISGKLTVGFGASWRHTMWSTVDITNGSVEVSLVLPGYYVPPATAHFAGADPFEGMEACLDCIEVVGARWMEEPSKDTPGATTAWFGLPWVNRGERIAVYHHGALSVGGFPAGLVVCVTRLDVPGRDRVADLGPSSPLWFGGYPTFCKESGKP